MKLLKSANSFVAIPGVGVAADAALSILALAQVGLCLFFQCQLKSYNDSKTVQSNKEAFEGLGEKACKIMVEVVRKVNVAEQPGSNTNRTKLEEECGTLCRYAYQFSPKRLNVTQLTYLQSAMKDVKKIVEKHVKGRNLLKRILFSQSDQDVIKKCTDSLQAALDVFSVRLSG